MDTIHIIMMKLELRKKYKSGNAIEIIRDAILSGDISGEIAQNDFADSLGVSRIPVREALIALEYHGLVEKLPNQHVRIIELSESSIRRLFADMSLVCFEAVKSLPEEILQFLSDSADPLNFHRYLYEHTAYPLRRVFLRIMTETYLTFILEHSGSSRIIQAFGRVKSSLWDSAALKADYAVYAETLSDELLRIRERRNINC